MENQDYKSLRIMHIAFCLGTTAILLINHFLIQKISFDNLNAEIDTLSLIIIASGTIMAILSILAFKKITSSTQAGTINIINLRKASIIKWGILEGGALISFLLYFYSNTHQLTLISGLTLLVLLVISGPKQEYFE